MHEPYDNQADIDKVQRTVESISPGLRITSHSFRWNTNTVIEVGVTLPVKGNKKVIDNLVAAGFRKGHKRKKEVFGHYWDMKAGYSMFIDLRMPIPQAPKEDSK